MTISEGTNSRTVVVEKEFPYPPEKVWRALSEGPLIAQWLMKNDFQPVVGQSFRLRSEPVPQWDGIIECKVLTLEPGKTLSYTWSTLGLESVVTFTLEATTEGTHLRMEHAGFPVDSDHAYKGAQYGWRKFIGMLEQVLAEIA